jgi:hypothetical protein
MEKSSLDIYKRTEDCGGGGPGDFGGPREMHKAVCADCGQETEVPFKPTEGGLFIAETVIKNIRSIELLKMF